MITIINDIILFLILTGLLLAAVLLYAFAKVGFNFSKFKARWLQAEGNTRIVPSIIKILLIPVAIGLVLVLSNKVYADDLTWMPYSKVFVGIDYNLGENSPMCQRVGVNDRMHSNMGFQQYIFTKGNISLSGKFTHNSCVLNRDAPGVNAVGLTVEWIIK